MESTLLMSVGAIFAFVVFYQLEEKSWLDRLAPNYFLTTAWEFEMWQCASGAVIGLVASGSSLCILLTIGIVKQILLRIQERCDRSGFLNGMIVVSTLGGFVVGEFVCSLPLPFQGFDSFCRACRFNSLCPSSNGWQWTPIHHLHHQELQGVLHTPLTVHRLRQDLHTCHLHELRFHRRFCVPGACHWSHRRCHHSPAVRLHPPGHVRGLFYGCHAQRHLPHALHPPRDLLLHALLGTAADGACVHILHHRLPDVYRHWTHGGLAETGRQECQKECQEQEEDPRDRRSKCIH